MGVTVQTKPSRPQLEASAGRRQDSVKSIGFLEHFFYLCMSVLIIVVVLYGFSRTGQNFTPSMRLLSKNRIRVGFIPAVTD